MGAIEASKRAPVRRPDSPQATSTSRGSSQQRKSQLRWADGHCDILCTDAGNVETSALQVDPQALSSFVSSMWGILYLPGHVWWCGSLSS